MRFSRPRRYLTLLACVFALAAGMVSAAQGIAVPSIHRYTPDSWPAALSADLYRPLDVEHPAVVLVIHGGGWIKGSRQEDYVQAICRHLVSQGFAALAVDYRLAPAYRFPAQLDDLAEALRWLRQAGPRLGLDTRQVGVWGYSAGAHLASMISTRAQALPIGAVVAGGTPADLRVWPDSPYVNALLGKRRDAAPELWARASPVTRVNAATPPHFLYHGRFDTLVEYDQALKLQAALTAVHVPVTLVTRWLYGHMLTAVLPGSSYDQASDFLKARLRPDAMVYQP